MKREAKRQAEKKRESFSNLQVKPLESVATMHELLLPFYKVILFVNEDRTKLRVRDCIFGKLTSDEELPSLVSSQLIAQLSQTLFELGSRLASLYMCYATTITHEVSNCLSWHCRESCDQAARELAYDISTKLKVVYRKREKKTLNGIDASVNKKSSDSFAHLVQEQEIGNGEVEDAGTIAGEAKNGKLAHGRAEKTNKVCY